MVRLWRLPSVGFTNDIETGIFEMAKDSLTASDRLLEQYPDAQVWFVRIGHRAVHRIGFTSSNVP